MYASFRKAIDLELLIQSLKILGFLHGLKLNLLGNLLISRRGKVRKEKKKSSSLFANLTLKKLLGRMVQICPHNKMMMSYVKIFFYNWFISKSMLCVMILLNRCTGVNQKQMRKDHLLQFGFTIKSKSSLFSN